MVSSTLNSDADVISLTSSSDEEEDAGPQTKKFKFSPVESLPQISITPVPVPVRNTENNVILLDSDDEGPDIKKISNRNRTNGEDNSSDKNKVKNPITEILKKNGISVRQKGEVLALVVDSDSDNTDIEKNEVKQQNLAKTECKKNIKDEDNKNGKRDHRKEKLKRPNGTNKVTNVVRNPLNIEALSAKSYNNGESIVIDDSDDDTEKENHCENDIEPFPVNIGKTSSSDVSSASAQDESRTLFKKFLKILEEKIVDSSFEEVLPKKVPIIEKYFKKCGQYVTSEAFKLILHELIEKIQTSQNSKAAQAAVLAFHKVFGHLKSHAVESAITIEKDNYPKVKKLERTMKLLKKKIKQLDEAEVDLNDDNDNESPYVMIDKYLARLNKVYIKYCQYIGRNPRTGASNDKIYYVNSKHNAINRALSKKYQNPLNFPTYYELRKFIEKVAKKENLNLSEQELRKESETSFEYLGSILQKKRKHELYASHLNLIEFTEDPAVKNIALENVLKKNYVEGKEKIEKVFQLYVNKQNQGEDYESPHEGESSDESDAEKSKKQENGLEIDKKHGENKEEESDEGKNEEKKEEESDEGNEENIEEKNNKTEGNESKENKSETIKMDKGKSPMNGSKTVKKRSRQIIEGSDKVSNNATNLSEKLEELNNDEKTPVKIFLNDTSLERDEDVMEI